MTQIKRKRPGRPAKIPLDLEKASDSEVLHKMIRIYALKAEDDWHAGNVLAKLLEISLGQKQIYSQDKPFQISITEDIFEEKENAV